VGFKTLESRHNRLWASVNSFNVENEALKLNLSKCEKLEGWNMQADGRTGGGSGFRKHEY